MSHPDPEIVFTVEADGKVTFEVNGVIGPSCQALSHPYSEMFETVTDIKKAEYVQQTTIKAVASQRLG